MLNSFVLPFLLELFKLVFDHEMSIWVWAPISRLRLKMTELFSFVRIFSNNSSGDQFRECDAHINDGFLAIVVVVVGLISC